METKQNLNTVVCFLVTVITLGVVLTSYFQYKATEAQARIQQEDVKALSDIWDKMPQAIQNANRSAPPRFPGTPTQGSQ